MVSETHDAGQQVKKQGGCCNDKGSVPEISECQARGAISPISKVEMTQEAGGCQCCSKVNDGSSIACIHSHCRG